MVGKVPKTGLRQCSTLSLVNLQKLTFISLLCLNIQLKLKFRWSHDAGLVVLQPKKIFKRSSHSKNLFSGAILEKEWKIK